MLSIPMMWTGEAVRKSSKTKLEPMKPAAPVIKIIFSLNIIYPLYTF